jgi:hypothetical protein
MHLKYVRNCLKEKMGHRPTRDLGVGIKRSWSGDSPHFHAGNAVESGVECWCQGPS